jgi:hypothetical protein
MEPTEVKFFPHCLPQLSEYMNWPLDLIILQDLDLWRPVADIIKEKQSIGLLQLLFPFGLIFFFFGNISEVIL